MTWAFTTHYSVKIKENHILEIKPVMFGQRLKCSVDWLLLINQMIKLWFTSLKVFEFNLNVCNIS